MAWQEGGGGTYAALYYMLSSTIYVSCGLHTMSQVSCILTKLQLEFEVVITDR